MFNKGTLVFVAPHKVNEASHRGSGSQRDIAVSGGDIVAPLTHTLTHSSVIFMGDKYFMVESGSYYLPHIHARQLFATR